MALAHVVVAVAALAALAVAFLAHPIGDHATESDFYEYALGGRALARGEIDFARYGVIGPVYELAMAIPAVLGAPAFAFARLLSVAAYATVLLAWLAISRRRLGAHAALVTVLLLVANPVLFRYAYSATTDLLALGLQSLSLVALLAWRGRAAPWIAGAAAALAVLTRYSSAFLVPGAVAYFLWLDEGADRPRRLVRWLAGFAVIALPWTLAAAAHGHWPGEALFSNAAFYASESATDRNVQDRPAGEIGVPATEARPPGVIARMLAGVPAHGLEDARQLLRIPTAALCALGLVLLVRERRWRSWLPLGVQGLLAFLTLAPVFYSDRYSLAVLPFYLSLAGAGVAAMAAWSRGPLAGVVPWLLVAWPLADTLAANVRLQRFVHVQLPRDALAVAPLLRGRVGADEGLVARKAAVAFLSGARPVAFPRVGSLEALARHARENRARYLYYSWYEGRLRQEFWYLLDTTAAVPGLERVASHPRPAAVLYRIGPDFGRDPEWMSDANQLAIHVARGQIRGVEERDAWEAHAVLGRHARAEGRSEEALEHFRALTRGRPEDSRGWVALGDALFDQSQFDLARAAYERARSVNPRSLGAQAGIGWTHYRAGGWAAAARAWRPIVDVVEDRATLEAMVEAFERSGDSTAAARARRALTAAGAASPR